MATEASSFSRPFTISFCDKCSDTNLSMGGSPFDISVKSKSMPNFTLIAGVPFVYQEDILEVIRRAGVSKGTCSVKVNLKTKEIVFISSSPWESHKCAKVENFDTLFAKALEKASRKKSLINPDKIEKKSKERDTGKTSIKVAQPRLSYVTSSIVGTSAEITWVTAADGQSHTATADLSKPTEGVKKFGPGSYSVKQ